MFYSFSSILFIGLVVAGCASQKRQQKWNDIDYSKVRDRSARENDSNYTQPTIVGCVDDDLINCK